MPCPLRPPHWFPVTKTRAAGDGQNCLQCRSCSTPYWVSGPCSRSDLCCGCSCTAPGARTRFFRHRSDCPTLTRSRTIRTRGTLWISVQRWLVRSLFRLQLYYSEACAHFSLGSLFRVGHCRSLVPFLLSS